MKRSVVRLGPDLLAELTEPCRDCVFWQLDPVRRSQVDGRAGDEKSLWLEEVLREWGTCGQVVLMDRRPVGHAIYAPAAYLPGVATFPTAPPSPDAVVLASVHVAAEHRRGGLGRLLVQRMARDLVTRGDVGAVEAFVDPRGRGGGCAVPQQFLSAVGFTTQRAHPTSPRMRMDLRAALTWKDEVELAVERLLGVVRPSPSPKASGTQAMNASSSLSIAALGLAPTIDLTTSPPE